MPNYEIFYNPGLGDQASIDRQKRYIGFLNKHRKSLIFFFDTLWETDEQADDKVSRMFEAYKAAGKPRKIFGISAGAAMTIILGNQYENTELVTIAGKHRGSSTIGENYQKRAPAFLKIVQTSEQILEESPEIPQRLTSYIPWPTDGVVPKIDIKIENATNKIMPIPFHLPAIVASLVTILPRY